MADFTTSAREAITGGSASGAVKNLQLLLQRVAIPEGQAQREAHRDAVFSWAAKNPGGWRDTQMAESLDARRRRVIELHLEAGGAAGELTIAPLWRLIIGAGAEVTPLEVGLRLAVPYGIPVIPGSALKGATRAHARALTEHGGEIESEELVRLFGPPPGETSGSAGRGSVSFLDALPTGSGARIELDVLTPHHSGWYRDPAARWPDGVENPIPVTFPTVASSTRFRVAVLGDDQRDVDRAVELLGAAVTERGLGAKTSAGYGYMTTHPPTS